MVWCELGDECFELVSTLYRQALIKLQTRSAAAWRLNA